MREVRIKRILLCIAILLIILGFTGYFTAKTLFRNPLLAACKELNPGMSEAEAFETVEKHRSGKYFRFIGQEMHKNTPGRKQMNWIDFPLDRSGLGIDRFATPDWLPISIEYRDDKGLDVWICDGTVCESEMSTHYHYSKSLTVEIPVPRGVTQLTPYEDVGFYLLEDNCGPKK